MYFGSTKIDADADAQHAHSSTTECDLQSPPPLLGA